MRFKTERAARHFIRVRLGGKGSYFYDAENNEFYVIRNK